MLALRRATAVLGRCTVGSSVPRVALMSTARIPQPDLRKPYPAQKPKTKEERQTHVEREPVVGIGASSVAHEPDQSLDLQAVLDENPEKFAVFESGGRQYKVTNDDIVALEHLPVDIGEKVVMDKVLLVGGKTFSAFGRPYVANATVEAVCEQQVRAAKVNVFKKRRRKNSQRWTAHRQNKTVLRVTDITFAPQE